MHPFLYITYLSIMYGVLASASELQPARQGSQTRIAPSPGTAEKHHLSEFPAAKERKGHFPSMHPSSHLIRQPAVGEFQILDFDAEFFSFLFLFFLVLSRAFPPPPVI